MEDNKLLFNLFVFLKKVITNSHTNPKPVSKPWVSKVSMLWWRERWSPSSVCLCMGSEQSCHAQKVLELESGSKCWWHSQKVLWGEHWKNKRFSHVFQSGNNQNYGLFLSEQGFRHECQTLQLHGWRGTDQSQRQDEEGKSWAELFRVKTSLSHHIKCFVQWTVENSIFVTTSI